MARTLIVKKSLVVALTASVAAVALASGGPSRSPQAHRTTGVSVAAPPVTRRLGEFTAPVQRVAEPTSPVTSVVHRGGSNASRSKQAKAPGASIHYTGFDGWEPTLGLTSNGDMFLESPGAMCCGFVEVIRSRDRGDSWELVTPKLPSGDNRHLISADPYVYADRDTGRVFTDDLTLACSLLSYTDDSGDSWTTNPIACGMPLNDHQTLFSGPPAISRTVGYPNVVYYCFNHLVALSTYCSKSLDGGLTFVPTGTPAFANVDPSDSGPNSGVPFVCGGTTGHGVVGPDGTVYLPRVECGKPTLAISSDEGLSWKRVVVSEKEGIGHEAGVAVDRDGNIYFVWTADDMLPYLVVSRDGGETWADPVLLAPPGLEQGVLPGVTVGAPGEMAMVYLGTKDGESSYWNGYVTRSSNVLGPRPRLVTTQVGTSGDPLSRASCLHRCLDLGDFFDVVIDDAGTSWAAFVDACISIACTTGADGNDEDEQGIVVEIPRRR